MTPDALEWTRRLSAWLADTDLQELELRSPQMSLRLQRRGRSVAATAPASAVPAASGPTARATSAPGEPVAARPTTMVRAPSVGVLRHRHPQREADLAPVGTRVHAGQPVALLQIGTLLLPVPAPRDGVATRRLAEDGAAVGYGDDLIELSE